MLRWISERKNTIFIVAGILLLFALIMIVSFQFFKPEEEEKPNIEKEPVVLPGDDEFELVNSSSMTVDEIWDLVEEKKDALRSLFYENVVYLPSSIAPDQFTSEDDEKSIIFAQSFLQSLNELVTDEIYQEVLSQMTLVKNGYYVANKKIFDKVYVDSAIAEVDITTSELRVAMASDEKISCNVTIMICEDGEDEEHCSYEKNIPFELVRVNDEWKISAFFRLEDASMFEVSSDV